MIIRICLIVGFLLLSIFSFFGNSCPVSEGTAWFISAFLTLIVVAFESKIKEFNGDQY